ncbi:hypothetical protein [Mycobacteroides abscessus]|uniref:hypothetical protein n=1 Tax=Mycobacteroides abscessus TaxID=36809 RepID=UPI000C26264D|nr:hypothetical protein [Mycobacteroides abscessus]
MSVHFDGHPATRLPTLHALIRRDGATKVADTILRTPHGWLLLDENQTGDPLDDDGVVAAAGYGQECIDDLADDDYWTPETPIPDHINYIYLLAEDGSIDWAETTFAPTYEALHWQTDPPQT